MHPFGDRVKGCDAGLRVMLCGLNVLFPYHGDPIATIAFLPVTTELSIDQLIDLYQCHHQERRLPLQDGSFDLSL